MGDCEQADECVEDETVSGDCEETEKCDKMKSLYPKNDYSGLNSLRARLANRGWDGNPNTMPRAMQKRNGGRRDR